MECRRPYEAPEWERQVIDVTVNQVELIRPIEDLCELDDVRAQRVPSVQVQPERFRRSGGQSRTGDRVTAREQGNAMAASDELLREVGHDALRAAIQGGWDALVEGGDLCDPHGRVCVSGLDRPEQVLLPFALHRTFLFETITDRTDGPFH